MIAAPEVRRSDPGQDFVRLLAIVRGEFLEMPGLRLTKKQAQRLWALDRDACDALLITLESSRFLRQTRDGEYHARLSQGLAVSRAADIVDRQMTWKVISIAAAAVCLIVGVVGCAGNPPPVPVFASRADWEILGGRWSGA